jgi:hypothetical protein
MTQPALGLSAFFQCGQSGPIESFQEHKDMTPTLPLYGSVLIYGASGHTAELIIERALSEGACPILADSRSC